MNTKFSKTNFSQDFQDAILEEVRMSAHERLRAKASLARAEAFGDAVVEIINLVKFLLKTLIVRPFQRLTTAIG